MIASHYLDAYRADPDAADAVEIRTAAREALSRAGRRAASLAASEQAQRYFEQAAELAEEPAQQAELLERAGICADEDRRGDEAIALLERAIELWQGEGLTHPAARGEARLAMACFNHGQVDTATERMGRSYEVLSRDEPDADTAMLAGQLARFRFLLDDLDGALEPLELALEIAESLLLPDVLSDALNTKGLIVDQHGHREEGLALMRHALDLALEHDLGESAMRAYFNLSFLMAVRDRVEEAMASDEQGRELARRRGNRQWEESFTGHLRGNRYFLGEWDDLDEPAEELLSRSWDELLWSLRLDFAGLMVPVNVARGRLDEARKILDHVPDEPRAETQERAAIAVGRACLAQGERRSDEALEWAEDVCSLRGTVGPAHPHFKQAIAVGLDAALSLGDLDRVEPIFERIRALSPAQRSPFVEAQLARYDAHLAARRPDAETAEARFRHAGALLREVGARFWLAVVLLEHAEWSSVAGREEEAATLLAEAREIFERLGAAPWLERLDALAEPAPA